MPMTEAQRIWKKNNKDKVKASAKRYWDKNYEQIRERWLSKREEYNARQVASYYENPERVLYSAAKVRAKKLDLDFDLEKSDIVIPELCPILQVPMVKGGKYAPSLDRLDNSKGYVKGNVWVISRKANTMKSDATQAELKCFAEWAAKYVTEVV
jgi:hypothetical protein